MIHTIQHALFYHICPGSEDQACSQEYAHTLKELQFLERKKGHVIGLPVCTCGVRTFLKADYTLKELRKLTQTVVNDYGEIWAYTIPLRHAYNLYAHTELYTAGHTAIPPVILLDASTVARIEGSEYLLPVIYGHRIIEQTVPQFPVLDTTLLLSEALL